MSRNNLSTQKVVSDIISAFFLFYFVVIDKVLLDIVVYDGKGGNTICQVWYFTKRNV